MKERAKEELRFPLSWPAGWVRTPLAERKRGRFRDYGKPVEIRRASKRLADQMQRLGATEWVISSNMPLRMDGLPSVRSSDSADSGVAIYFKLRGKDRVLACDRYISVADNVTAIALHVGALRAMERYGVGSLDQAFAGYAALPENTAKDWRSVFGFDERGAVSFTEVEERFRELARGVHPDRGGSHEAMARLSEAKAFAAKECYGYKP